MKSNIMPTERWDSIGQYLLYLRHLAAYALFAKEFVADKKVLEIGCGTGYGANELSKCVSFLAAIDVSEENILYCQTKYSKDRSVFILGDGISLPFKAGTFDVVMSFQVIEHIPSKTALNYLAEIKRVMKPGGVFILSTPNSRLRLLPFQKPWNPEHKKEYKNGGLKTLLSKAFQEVKVYGLCASEEVLSIEKNRVKQTPLKAYVVIPLYRLLQRFLPSSLLFRLRRTGRILLKPQKGEQGSVSQEVFTSKFSLKDFRINPDCPKDCIDLYGICKKTEGEISQKIL